jgi:hypothetical protein
MTMTFCRWPFTKHAIMPLTKSGMRYDFAKNCQNRIIFASDRVIKTKPEAVRSFVKAFYEIIAHGRSRKPEAVAFMKDEFGEKDSVANAVCHQLINSDFFPTHGRIEQGTPAAMRSFVELNLMNKEEGLSKYVDTSILPKSN